MVKKRTRMIMFWSILVLVTLLKENMTHIVKKAMIHAYLFPNKYTPEKAFDNIDPIIIVFEDRIPTKNITKTEVTKIYPF